MKKFKLFSLIFFTALTFCNITPTFGGERAHCPQNWHTLQHGNQQFIDNPKYAQQRAQTAKGQNPPYVVLSCADSRTPPELIFNQGLGKIFCPRVAGNTAGDQVIDSIEFAVNTWDVNTVVVLGHESCGAVVGALERLKKNNGKIDHSNGTLYAVLIPIEKAIIKSGIDIYAKDALEQSIKANVSYTARQLIKKSPDIAKALKTGQIVIIGAVYSLKSGKVHQLFVIDKNNI